MKVAGARMNPEKLFAYLEGNLPALERVQFEEALAADPQLRRELEIARHMHERAPGSREVLGVGEDLELAAAPPSNLGRRVATAAAILVFLNVLIGIVFIVGSQKKKMPPELREKEAAMREQLAASLQKAGENALPTPTFDGDEIRVTARSAERNRVADQIVVLAREAGGSASKAPPDENGMTVLATIPSVHEAEFRRALAPIIGSDFASSTPEKPNPRAVVGDNKTIYLRIATPPQP